MKDRQTQLLHGCNLALTGLVAALGFYNIFMASLLCSAIAAGLLSFLLIAPKLLKVPSLRSIHPQLLAVARQSKWTGLWMAAWVIAHLGLVLAAQALPSLWLAGLIVAIFGLLAAISNSWSYAHLKWWKHLNMLVWATPPLLIAHFLLLGWWPLTVPLFLSIAAGVWAVWLKPRDYFVRHRLWLLLAGALLGLLAVLP